MQITSYNNYSYWELKQLFKNFDLAVIGGGIVGLSTAISYKQLNRKARIIVLERGIFSNGASMKNAGFACFGSAGELLDDLNNMPENVVWQTVEMRWKGLLLLRNRLKDKNIAYREYGGFELFDKNGSYDQCVEKLNFLNAGVAAHTGQKNCFKDLSGSKAKLFNNIVGTLKNKYEGQIDTGLMMKSLHDLALKFGIEVLNNIDITDISDGIGGVKLESNAGVFTATKVVVATNGYARQLLDLQEVKPARAQVLITKEIKGLRIKGCYHYQQGYYYFRNIDGRILLGGGRNLDPKTETTTDSGLHPGIQKSLDALLKETILPGCPFEIEHRWSGIMGIGKEKKPIIKRVSKNVLAAVRMGGMGIAIGSLVGELAATEIS